jgi:DME family drug/metabolite transporter
MNILLNARARLRHGLPLIIIAAALWGTVGVATRAIYGLAETNALSIGLFRLAIAAPVLWVACWGALGRRALRVARRDLALMLLMGAVTALYQVCYFAAIARVGVAIAVLVTLCTAPVLVALLSAALLRERLGAPVLAALLCALVGTVLLVDVGEVGRARGQLLPGLLLSLGSAFGYAVITLCSRALAGRYHPLQPITIGFTAGAIMLLPFALVAGLVVTYPTQGWALLLYLALVPTALAYGFFLAGIRSTTATAASIVTLVEPLISTALAWLLFGERLSPLALVGALLLLGAIVLLQRGRPRPHEEHRNPSVVAEDSDAYRGAGQPTA